MKQLTVRLSEYTTDLIIDKKVDRDWISENGITGNIVVSDTNIAGLSASGFIGEINAHQVVLCPGEAAKTLDSVQKICAQALDCGLGRDSLFTGVGGGVVCDMTAFAASIYMRGCRVNLVPTSLLSMVDATIGGKTGVDFMDRKNILGSFFPAGRIFIATEYLESLSTDEYLSGLAEIIKHAFLTGGELLDILSESRIDVLKRDPDLLEEIIYKSLLIKARYVEEDFREAGMRAHLNFGHTFGHALETAAGLGRFTHGGAVAWGMARALKAGVLLGHTDQGYAEMAIELLKQYGYHLDFSDFDTDTFINAAGTDKKKKDGEVRFVLQNGLADTFLTPVEAEILRVVIEGHNEI